MSFPHPGSFAPLPSPGWYPDALGVLRWWDGTQWTHHISGPPVGYLGHPAFAPVARSRGRKTAVWIASGLAVLLVLAVVVVGAIGGVRKIEKDELATGFPGYYTAKGSHGMPLLVGAPWGQPCAPVVLKVGQEVPEAAYDALVEVVEEARAVGLPITVANRIDGTWDTSDYVLEDTPLPGFVTVVGESSNTEVRAGDPDARFEVESETELVPGGQYEYLTAITETFYFPVIESKSPEYRPLMRRLVGFSHGVYDADDKQSALKNRNSSAPDEFTGRDLAAMQQMSGCSEPDTETGEVSA